MISVSKILKRDIPKIDLKIKSKKGQLSFSNKNQEESSEEENQNDRNN